MRFILCLVMSWLAVMPMARAAQSQADITAFCAQPNVRKPFPGKQFDGQAADKTVMGLKPGYYPLNDNGYVQVLDKGVWLMQKPQNIVTFFAATAYSGGQIHTVGNLIGSCNLEFLSEEINRNHISLLSATPVDPDSLPNTRMPGQLP